MPEGMPTASHMAELTAIDPSMSGEGFKVLPEQIGVLIQERQFEHAEIRACRERDAEWRSQQAARTSLSGMPASVERNEASDARGLSTSHANSEAIEIPLYAKNVPSAYPRTIPALVSSSSAGNTPKRSSAFLALPAELRNRVYEHVDVQRSISRHTRVEEMYESVTPPLARTSRQVRREFLAISMKDRTFSADTQHIDSKHIKKWLRIFKAMPVAKDQIASFTILWSQGVAEDYLASLPYHPTFEPSMCVQSHAFHSEFGSIAEAVCNAGLSSPVVSFVLHKEARIGKEDRRAFDERMQEMFQRIDDESRD